MRYFLLLFVFISCKSDPSPEEKSQKAISEYIKTYIDDVSSYQSVIFRPLRLDSTDMDKEPEYLKHI